MHTMIAKRWTLHELTRYLHEMLETDYRLRDLEVIGELSNLRIPQSGHAYFTLKDAEAQMPCVMWASDLLQVEFAPRDGIQVVVRGSVGIYQKSGTVQIYCRSMQPAGVGDLYAQFEQLKTRLQAEGLFDPAHKKPLPDIPIGIGIVTSPSTAALQDVLNVLRRRSPAANLVLEPTPVQGDEAPPQIADALERINQRTDIEVILLVRGGGSLEDLWSFNDERVVRAVAASRLPVITGIGHEIDFTLSDFAASQRAPSPSAAAELATRITRDDLHAQFTDAANTLDASMRTTLNIRERQIAQAVDALGRNSPQALVRQHRQTIDLAAERLWRDAAAQLALRRTYLEGLVRTLDNAGPEHTLARGYAIVRLKDGSLLRDVHRTAPGDAVNIRLYRGSLKARIEQIEPHNE